MNNSSRFDLEKALAAWRRTLESNRAFSDEDREELERHLRDQVAALVGQGLSQQAAFDQALRELGPYGVVEAEYQKVYWGKLKRHHQLVTEVMWRGSMFKNYLHVALRHAVRHSGYTFINVTGLTVGVLCCLLALLYVRDERSYDRHTPHADDVYRLYDDLIFEGRYAPSPIVPANWAMDIAAAFPEVEAVVRFDPNWGSRLVRHGDHRFYEPGQRIYRTDPAVFETFGFDFLQGDPATALDAANAIVLTESTARKYFGDQDPMGQVLTVSDEEEYVVTGVLEEPPLTSHLQFGFLTSMRGLDEAQWPRRWLYSYLRLRSGTDAGHFATRMASFLHDRYGEAMQGVNRAQPALQPLTSIHLHADLLYEMRPGSDAAVVTLFSIIAALILLVACINFMNLATASATTRIKEVGVRKVMGAGRIEVAKQFFGEALLLSGLSVACAVVLLALVLPAFNALADKAIPMQALVDGPFLVGLLGLALLVGLVAGSYPALFLAGFRPALILRQAPARGGGVRLRQGLVVMQFAVAVVMIVATLVVREQLHFFRSHDLGFEADQLVVVPVRTEDAQQQLEGFRDTWAARPDVVDVSFTSTMPGDINTLPTLRMQPEGAAADAANLVQTFFVDPDFPRTLGVEVIAGRDFSRDLATDTTALLLNETAAARFGWTPAEALGKSVDVRGQAYHVVGVVRDFHFASLHETVAPVAFLAGDDLFSFGMMAVRIRPDDLPRTLAALQATWTARLPGVPFEFTFLDDDLYAQYQAEVRQGTLFTGFAVLAILIAVLGLFGLAAFTAARRTKEIGIRKVLGAGVPALVGLLSGEFLKLVGIAFVVAVPVAYVAMQRWLDGFAYRVELEPGVFLLAGALVLVIALLTVSYQAVRAALADPIESLRYE